MKEFIEKQLILPSQEFWDLVYEAKKYQKMNQQAKQIMEQRAKEIYDYYSADELAVIEEVLEKFIEHPTKPGYKRQDIEYFLKLLNNE